MAIQTIALFGGSGRTGIPFIKKSLNDYTIKALVRNPDKLEIRHKNLQIIPGNVMNPEDIEACIAGADVVVSLIGHDKNSPVDFQTSATDSMLRTMKKLGVSRIISLTGGGVRDEVNDQPGFIDKFVVFAMKNLAGKGTRNALQDGISHARLIRSSDSDWTIVRVPMLTEEPANGRLELGAVGKVKGFKVTREDVAEFLFREIAEKKYIHQMPFITNGK
jgi:putative NADH-flavin reductase